MLRFLCKMSKPKLQRLIFLKRNNVFFILIILSVNENKEDKEIVQTNNKVNSDQNLRSVSCNHLVNKFMIKLN